MTRAGFVVGGALAGAALAFASQRTASAADETAEARAPVFVGIDFDALPVRPLPVVPSADPAPSLPGQQPATGLKVQKTKLVVPAGKKKRAKGLSIKGTRDVVEISPTQPEIGAMYVPSTEQTDLGGESVSRLPCRQKAPGSALRWETLTVGPDGDADLEVKDMWFDSESCAVFPRSTAHVVFKAVAWEGTHPWLFAVRDDKAVTFLFPRTSDVSSDAMVGTPVTMRGGFTRISLPLGRWGSSSFVAHVPSLQFEPPSPAKPGSAKADEEPAEVAVEVVQTLSERSPTVLVRRSEAH